jgi:hypothetical protein
MPQARAQRANVRPSGIGGPVAGGGAVAGGKQVGRRGAVAAAHVALLFADRGGEIAADRDRRLARAAARLGIPEPQVVRAARLDQAVDRQRHCRGDPHPGPA